MIEWLVERQRESGLGDREFAQFLGVSRPSWVLVKGGKRQPSDWFRMRVLEAYPERCQEILALEHSK